MKVFINNAQTFRIRTSLYVVPEHPSIHFLLHLLFYTQVCGGAGANHGYLYHRAEYKNMSSTKGKMFNDTRLNQVPIVIKIFLVETS